jgi:homocitrate synthase NifV
VNGIGERAGNTALEEIAVAVKTNKIPMQPLKLSKIQELCDRVSLLTNSTISDSKPITGKSVFLHESGIHWNALLKNKHAFEAFPPSITGHARSVPVAGTHSGGATVRAILGKNRMKISDTDSRRVAASIRKKVHRIGRVLTTREVENLCERHLS